MADCVKIIYGIFDRKSRRFVYVGQSGNITQRKASHKKRFPDGIFIPFETVLVCDAVVTEKKWINDLLGDGHELENIITYAGCGTTINLVIPDDKKDDLEEIAIRKGLSLSGLVRMVLYEYIEAQQNNTAG